MTIDRNSAGVFAIAPTPFHTDGAVDYDSIDSLVDFYAGVGVDGITVLGQLGEAPKLDQTEAQAVARRFISRSNLPVVVGVSAPGFAAMKALSTTVMEAGAAGVMIAPPNTLRSDEQIVGYYRQAVQAIGRQTPLVVQDYPLTTSVVMSVDVIARIALEADSFVMLKHEDWPGLDKISKLREREQAGKNPRISILCGNGGLFLDFETERGADGAMTGYCFPDMLVELVTLARSGQRSAAHDLYDAHLPLIRYEQQQGLGLAVRKYVLARRGVIRSSAQRSPASALSARGVEEVDFLLQRLAASDKRAAFALEPDHAAS